MPREDAFLPVLLYYLVLGVIVAGINLFWTSVFDITGLGSLLMPALETGAMSAVVEFLLSPLLLLATLYVVSGVCHLILLMAGAAKHEFGATNRVFAYSYSPAAFAVVPLVGNLVAFFWMTVVAIIGLREAHETRTGKAALAVLLPLAFLLMLLMIAAAIAIMAGVLGTRL